MSVRRAIKLAVLSDVHLEVRRAHLSRMGMTESGIDEMLAELGRLAAEKAAEADLVIIAGDLAVGCDGIAWAEISFAGKPVVYIAGNHEFYRHEIDPLLREMHVRAGRTRNVRFLENEQASFPIAGQALRVLGCTLWTDYTLFGRIRRKEMMEAASMQLLDHRRIRSPRGGFYLPDEALARHEASRTWLGAKLALPFDGITVVATHHAPLGAAIAPQYEKDTLSPAFANDCSDLLSYEPAAWVFGHTHFNFDRRVGATRLFSYQWGYPGEGMETQVGILSLPLSGADDTDRP